jgi:hypothetical protein
MPAENLNVDVPHSARIYDYLLGGKDNYQADRDAAAKALAVNPNARTSAIENRKFMGRAVAWLASMGVDQFLDIGTGIPTTPNLHQSAQAVNSAVRVMYVDNDPLVL